MPLFALFFTILFSQGAAALVVERFEPCASPAPQQVRLSSAYNSAEKKLLCGWIVKFAAHAGDLKIPHVKVTYAFASKTQFVPESFPFDGYRPLADTLYFQSLRYPLKVSDPEANFYHELAHAVFRANVKAGADESLDELYASGKGRIAEKIWGDVIPYNELFADLMAASLLNKPSALADANGFPKAAPFVLDLGEGRKLELRVGLTNPVRPRDFSVAPPIEGWRPDAEYAYNYTLFDPLRKILWDKAQAFSAEKRHEFYRIFFGALSRHVGAVYEKGPWQVFADRLAGPEELNRGFLSELQ